MCISLRKPRQTMLKQDLRITSIISHMRPDPRWKSYQWGWSTVRRKHLKAGLTVDFFDWLAKAKIDLTISNLALK